MQKGILISLHGIDGSGKTQIIHELEKWFKERRINVTITSELRSPVFGDIIKNKLVIKGEYIPLLARTLAFALDLYHRYSIYKESLKKGYIVLADRHYFCAYAYILARYRLEGPEKYWGISEEDLINWIKDVYRFVDPPHIAFLLDIEPELARKRLIYQYYGGSENRLTAYEKDSKLQKIVRSLYVELFNGILPKIYDTVDFHIVNASRKLSEVVNTIETKICESDFLPDTFKEDLCT